MTDDPQQRLTDDLAFVRSLAEEGQSLPLRGGRFFVLWGVFVAVSALIHWAVVIRLLLVPYWIIPVTWFGLGMIAGVCSSVLARQLKKSKTVSSIGNQVEQSVWQVAGLFFAIFAVGLFMISVLRIGPGATVWPQAGGAFSLFPPVGFGVYAIAIAASARAARQPQLNIVVAASFFFLLVTLVLAGSASQLLVNALGAVMVLIIPGLIQIRNEQKTGPNI